MTTSIIILAIVVITALAFDFTNGFHDTANAMATSIATGALKPKTAVLISALLNLVGAFLSVNVAATVAKGIVNLENFDLTSPGAGDGDGRSLLLLVFAGLIGGIIWNLFTWLLGLPSSSSHALFGGLIGAALATMGSSGVAWTSILGKIIIPAVASPFIAALVSSSGTALVYWITNTMSDKEKAPHFRHGQIVTACLVSLAHGTGDAQKTMGVIFLALVAEGQATQDQRIPLWIIVCCAVAIAAGTLSGGWRVIRTLGKGLVEIDPPQGMAAEASSAAIILTSSVGGMALSTTHVSTGSILGSGLGRKGASVRWGVAMRMAAAWLITLPAAAVTGFVTWWVAKGASVATNDLVGVLVAFAILLATAGYIFWKSRQNPVHAGNVNNEWDPDSESITTQDSMATPAGTTVGA
ncbi:anion permease [Corynebacterium uberis]|uniref:inorganic phosphate transporter n=1 Tax=Corynebacterium TaxID=1716 RepID=UPI001D09C9F9|nr:inorganic phosphate transporter [Corynebacterium uberis]MCZ9309164.1 inorganic phosphate transporter [Corynebacterium sp. c6VSa_13]UDL74377.1 inorganic phosphate transporter [Corynebacterium uberis]UDL76789.1 inorganic phosphate transporter [Corynebacterium uberis]UDL79002.1 inorganic phosphate transporter [Corynebacterium uberis]UDL81279.1 inorganic phosphate transporter [Corynebacterium uberis]